MLSDELIPDVPSDYSGLHPADALSLVSYADGEDGEVVDLHCDTLQGEFLDARYHVGNHALDGSLRERSVVASHVFGQAVEVYRLSDDWIGVVLAVCLWHLGVLI